MFDWFREMGEELSGIDSTAAKKERMEKREQKKIECFIFTKKNKVLIIVMGIIYLLMSWNMIMLLNGMEKSDIYIIKYIIMDLIDIAVIFALICGKRKGEIIALIGSFIFVVGLFFSVLF